MRNPLLRVVQQGKTKGKGKADYMYQAYIMQLDTSVSLGEMCCVAGWPSIFIIAWWCYFRPGLVIGNNATPLRLRLATTRKTNLLGIQSSRASRVTSNQAEIVEQIKCREFLEKELW